jgi:hypothetical protein
MSFVQYVTIQAAPSSSGDYVAYSDVALNGFVQSVAHAAATKQMSTACTLVIAGENGLTVLSLAAASSAWQYYPRTAAAKTTGTSTELYSPCFIPLHDERLVVTLGAQAATSGCDETFKIWIG